MRSSWREGDRMRRWGARIRKKRFGIVLALLLPCLALALLKMWVKTKGSFKKGVSCSSRCRGGGAHIIENP